LERFILARANWVVCPATAARAQLQRDLQLADCPQHWHVISHAAPNMLPLERTSSRALLGWRDDEFHLLAIGRLAPVKRFSLLLAACIESNRTIAITLLGAGDAAALQAQLINSGATHIRLNILTTSDVQTYLSAADLYVSTSVNESFGMANVEAQACGCPAICTAVGGVPEAVGGGVWLVPGTLDALTLGIQTLYDDAILRGKWSAIGRQRVSLLPSSTKVAQLYESLYCSESHVPGATK
jgi:glycosyltransferase involved in cell wall biosynthesis